MMLDGSQRSKQDGSWLDLVTISIKILDFVEGDTSTVL
jgi:hypothetical protein